MSQASLEQLRALYPGRLTLSAEEVALILRHSTNRGVVQKVREGMQTGRYPDARKIDGRWHLPMEVVAERLDPTPKSTGSEVVIGAGSPGRPAGRRRSQIGPRMRFLRESQFWISVWRSLGWTEEFQEWSKERERERLELQDHFNSLRAARIKAYMRKELGLSN